MIKLILCLLLFSPSLLYAARASIAIVLDDAGYSQVEYQRLKEVDAPLTIAVLPHLRHSEDIARNAYQSGMEVIVHMPMQPLNSRLDPGPGALFVSMPEEELNVQLEHNINGVPYAVGVNNHMGSRLTSDERAMRTVLKSLSKRGLFFLDSLVVSQAVSSQLSQVLNVPVLKRDVFLDNRDELEAIQTQIRELIQVALKRGKAIGIGHVNRLYTAKAIDSMLPEIRKQDISIRYLSEMF